MEEGEATMTSRRIKRIQQLTKGQLYVQVVLKAGLILKLSLWTDVKIRTVLEASGSCPESPGCYRAVAPTQKVTPLVTGMRYTWILLCLLS